MKVNSATDRAIELAAEVARIRKHQEYLDSLVEQRKLEQRRIERIRSTDPTKGQTVDVYV